MNKSFPLLLKKLVKSNETLQLAQHISACNRARSILVNELNLDKFTKQKLLKNPNDFVYLTNRRERPISTKPKTQVIYDESDVKSNLKNEILQNSKQTVNTTSKKNNDSENIINLNPDEKRKEIGFEQVTLLDSEWKEIKVDFKNLGGFYSKLSKRNLSALVVCTTMMGCAMAPMPFDPYLFFYTTLGTSLTSSSANAFNQFLEVPYDSQMNRTKDRVLVRGNLTPLHAFTFASVVGVTGVSILYYFANPLTAALGASTLFLYTLVYTPMKRLSALNTWVGSVVGAIPPLMGYTAMTGQIGAPGLLMAAILYSWQFPHFHSLSWNLRAEYSRAGYRMISVLNPRICTSSALSHTIALLVMCSFLSPTLGLTTWNFAIDSLPFNLYFIYLAAQFKRHSDAQSSRKLFRYSLIYLPMVILLMLITKYPTSEKIHDLEKEKELELEKDLMEIRERVRILKKSIDPEKINSIPKN